MAISRTGKEVAVFTVFIGFVHYAYYKIQNNPSLVPPQQQTELFYVQWLKDYVPGLANIGIQKQALPPKAGQQ